MSQGDLFATIPPAAPKLGAWRSGWYCVAYLDPVTDIWRAISDLGRFPSSKEATEDLSREQPRHSHPLQVIPVELAGHPRQEVISDA